MDDTEVGAIWDANAEAWTALTRAGYDIWRDQVNTPAFLAMLPPTGGRDGIDIGCGEGANTRTVARSGARMTGIDISQAFIRAPESEERREPLGISYHNGKAQELPFDDARFDFATAFMSLMDVADYDGALREIWRVLRPGGFLQYSILHPCFTTAHRKLVCGDDGRTVAIEQAGYFAPIGFIEEWTFGAAPEEERGRWPKFRVPYFGRTLSAYLNGVTTAGFRIERIGEPCPDTATVERFPRLPPMALVAALLHVLARKPT